MLNSRSFWATKPVVHELVRNSKTLPQPLTPNIYQKPKVVERGKKGKRNRERRRMGNKWLFCIRLERKPVTTVSERILLQVSIHSNPFPFTVSLQDSEAGPILCLCSPEVHFLFLLLEESLLKLSC